MTSRKKFRAKLVTFKEWMKQNRMKPTQWIMQQIGVKLRGHYQFLTSVITEDNLKRVMTAIENFLLLIDQAIDSEKSYWNAQNLNWTEDEDSVPWNNFVYY